MTPDYQLFLITEDEILPIEKATLEEIVVVLHQKSKKIYVYRGQYGKNYDEFESGDIYDRLVNRFLNPRIFLLKTLDLWDDDSEEVRAVKAYLTANIDFSVKARVTRFLDNIIHLKAYRKKIQYFSTFESSKVWRMRVSNLTGLRKLSIFNAMAGGVATIWTLYILFGRILPAIHTAEVLAEGITRELWLESITIGGIGITILIGAIFLLNLVFVLFPLRFPIKPYEFEIGEREQRAKVEPPAVSPLPPAVSKMPPKIPKKSPSGPSVGKNEKGSKGKKSIKRKPEKAVFDHKNAGLDEELDIPAPPMPKPIKTKKKSGKAKSAGKSPKLPKLPPAEGKFRKILADCPICDKVLHMEIPESLVNGAEEPVVEITYLHGTPEHSLVVQLDHDFQVRRRRASWVVQDPK